MIMIVKVNKVKYNPETKGYIDDLKYTLDILDDVIINIITTKTPTYWYALIDGKLFKSDRGKGLKSICFSSEDELESALAAALYWKQKLVPGIGAGIGYDVQDFISKLKQTHNIEFKKVQF